MSLSLTTRFFISPNVRSILDKRGITILDTDKGVFHSIIGSGSIAWENLTVHPEGLTVETIANNLHLEFKGIPRQDVENDLLTLLRDLNKKGLVRIGNGEKARSESANGRILFLTPFLFRIITAPLIHLGRNAAAAFLYLAFFQLLSKIGGFQARRSAVKQWPVSYKRHEGSTNKEVELARLCAAVEEACTWFPKLSKCLQRSTVITCLLRQHGFHAQVLIGAHKMPFSSHAWVEISGSVISDHPDVQKYYKVIDVW
jgi:hypothetical protein